MNDRTDNGGPSPGGCPDGSRRSVYALKSPWLWLLALAAVLLVAAIACEEEEGGGTETPAAESPAPAAVTPGPGVSATEIKLGMTNDLAGTGGTPYGVITPAMQAYFAKVNQEDGGVCGRKVTLLSEDDQYNPSLALEKTRKLVGQDQVFAVVGATNTSIHSQVAPYLNDPNGDANTADGVPDLYVSTGWSGWGDVNTFPWTTGYIPDYVSDAKILAQYINDNFTGKKVGILYQNDPFGQDYLNGLKQALADPALLVAEQPYESAATDVSAHLLLIRDAGAEVVFLASEPEPSASAFKSAATLGYRPRWVMSYVNAHSKLAELIGGGTAPDQLGKGFQQLEGTISTAYLLNPVQEPDHPAIQEHKRIMETYAGPRDVTSLTVYAQSLAELVVETVSRSCDNLTRAGLLAAAESIKGFRTSLLWPGIEINLGPDDHYAIQSLQVVKIEADGKLTEVGQPISVE